MSDQRHDETSKPRTPAVGGGEGRGDGASPESGSGSKTALDPERWRRIAGVVEVALELDSATRAAYLEMLGRSNEDLRWQVLGVLRALGVVSSSDPLSEPTQPLPSAVKDRIGPWRVVRLLGRGGMGAVFLAVRDDEAYERQVAIKVISAGFEAPVVYRRFLAERQILASFDHPNIARLLDGGAAHDGRPFLVMEYVDGVPLDRFCFEGGAGLRARLQLFLKVCGAVAYAHRQLVVHRDLKPSNILVTPEGEPKLLDFGIAKLLDPAGLPVELELTRTANAVLTPKWASPEQLRGEAITTATDVYALGLLLYKVLVGELPHGDSSHPADALHRRGSPVTRPSREIEAGAAGASVAWPDEAPRQVAHRLRGDLDNIVLKALRSEPSHRYPSVSAFADDLERFLDGRPVSATRDTVPYLLRKFTSRYRWQVLAAAVLFVSIVTTASLAVLQANALRQQQEQTQEALEVAEAEARRAEASQHFLADLLRAADETERRRQELSLQDLLTEGLDRLEGGAIGDPQARLDLLGMLTRSFLEFRDLRSSRRTLELAVEASEQAGAGPLERATLLAHLAAHQIFDNDLQDGMWSCGKALELAPPDAWTIRHDCLEYVRYAREERGQLLAATEASRQILDSVAELDGPAVDAFLAEPGNILQELIELGEVDTAYLWTRSIAQVWASRGPEPGSAPPRAVDLIVALIEKREYAQADRVGVLHFRREDLHEHDIYAANGLGIWAEALVELGEWGRAAEVVDQVAATTDAMRALAPDDLRMRFLEGVVHHRRARIASARGDAEGWRRHIDAAIAVFDELRREMGFFLAVERFYLESLIEGGRLDDARLRLQALLDVGFRRPSTLSKARAAGLDIPDLPPPAPVDFAPPPNVQATFDRVAAVELPWEPAP
ncbi:MAG: serine/threonine-protein kinase [Acidobacteriota bacterium]